MAWLFELAAECGEDREDAEAFAGYFRGRKRRLADGFESTLGAEPYEDDPGIWWCRVVPGGMGQSGILPENAGRARELTTWLYELLREAPDFRIALVGVEAEAARSVESLVSPDDLLHGLVITQEIWMSLGMPDEVSIFPEAGRVETFRPGWVWIPPQGWNRE